MTSGTFVLQRLNQRMKRSLLINLYCKDIQFLKCSICSVSVNILQRYNHSKNLDRGHNRNFNSPLARHVNSNLVIPLSCKLNFVRTSASLNDQKVKLPHPDLTFLQQLPEKFVSSCPPQYQPYLRLSRVNRPIGTWLLFLPCTWGLTLGAQGIPDLSLIALFGIGAFIMRGAGCTINDMWDRYIDAKVKRTKDRPLASGQLRMRHALGWLGLQLSLAFTILLSLNAPCFIIGVGSLGLVVMYPLAKRVTNWPQGVLGLTFNTGVLMGYTAAQKAPLGYLSLPWLDPACLSLYLAGISWTLVYDTIYAHQDREDDTTLGLGSTARMFGEQTKLWIGGFSVTMISLLTTAGVMAELSWPYYAAVASSGAHLMWQIKTLDINNHKNCADRFDANRLLGWILFFGLAGSYLVHDKRKSSIIDLKASDKGAISNYIVDAVDGDGKQCIQPITPKYSISNVT